MYSSCRKSKPRYIVSDIDLIKFKRAEIQFLKWIQELEKRIYKNSQQILNSNGNSQYSCNAYQMEQMEACIKNYQENYPNMLAQDRFAWTVFASDLMKRHKEGNVHSLCSIKLCLFLLLWSSYHLNFSHLKQVQELLRHIIFCTGNLKFMFSFLPGMSMTSYIFNFVSKRCDEKDFCKEFFVSIEEIQSGESILDFKLYQCYSPMISYFVNNLTPFHSDICKHEFEALHGHYRCSLFKGKKFSYNLQSILNKAIVHKRKHTLLSLALDYRDKALFTTLLQLGASANVRHWEPRVEDFLTVEQMMISTMNSLVAMKSFITAISNDLHPSVKTIMEKLDSTNQCGIVMKRSLLTTKARKADNVWREKNWRYELNKEVAEVWGIGHKQTCPSLCHITKISIRQHILKVDKVRLPDAIAELPLPGPLKSYLNLLLD